MKLGTTIYHVSGHCWKGFRGQSSRPFVYKCVNRDIHFDVWRRGSLFFTIIQIKRQISHNIL